MEQTYRRTLAQTRARVSLKRKHMLCGLVLLGILSGNLAHSGDVGAIPKPVMPQLNLVIKDHRFLPSRLTIPSHTKFKLRVTNQDSTPSEFESSDLNREKIVAPGSTVTVFIGPLARGRYTFFDDFHQSTGNGVLIVE